MIENDTIRLLRECDSGVKMGVSSIEEVLDKVSNDSFKNILSESKSKHQKLQDDLQILLDKYHDDGKSPSSMAQTMSWFKVNMKIMSDNPDKAVADLITDGCNNGVKCLHKYLNKHESADEKSKDITKKLINLEEKLAVDIRSYL